MAICGMYSHKIERKYTLLKDQSDESFTVINNPGNIIGKIDVMEINY